MEFDLVHLSRLQFALTIMFHYLFPPLTIGLAGLMVCLEALWLKTGHRLYEEAARFWTRIFAVNFAMGVATGIVMEFQFGTNWATYSRFVGDVFGSALAAEGIFAFFLESGFLAVLVFGWDRVSKRVHFFSTCMVSLGSIFSSIWIVVANSWEQTPAGFHLVRQNGEVRAEVTDFWAMVFNPSTVDRLVHVLIGCYILAAFFVMSISAFYLLKRKHEEFARKSFLLALVLGTVMSLAALVQGDVQARTVSGTQPAKLAAMEAHFRTGEGGTPLYLFAVPNEDEARVEWAVPVPGLLSWLVYHDPDHPVRGLDQVPREDWPPVAMTFYSFRAMVGAGLLCIGLTLVGCWFWWRGTLFQKRWLLRLFVVAVALPYLANELGWVTAEVGRQPWVVYGLLRTGEGVSRAVVPSQVLSSIVLFGLIYLLLFAVWLNVMNDKIQHGPEPAGPATGMKPGGLVEVAGYRAGGGGPSLTNPAGHTSQPEQKEGEE